eukprot:PITA_27340
MTGNNERYIASIKKELRKGFEMTDLGYVHYYLGIEVTQHPKYTFLSQKKYIGDLLNRFGMAECNPLTTPMEQNLKLTSIEGKEFEDEQEFDGDKKTGVSTSGYVMSLGSRVVSWRSHKQSIPADSTIEAEYVTVAEATKEIVWIKKILEDLHVNKYIQLHS